MNIMRNTSMPNVVFSEFSQFSPNKANIIEHLNVALYGTYTRRFFTISFEQFDNYFVNVASRVPIDPKRVFVILVFDTNCPIYFQDSLVLLCSHFFDHSLNLGYSNSTPTKLFSKIEGHKSFK
ncbi:hypothetical protein BafPKo_AA0023 (plasmid) [Borreliella afzelii PKo]|uniref:Uncharacterized protein n=1 Tax=Borreliella afzelii (strain PKo) TaxID=390236 RepID=G0ITQ3_BORAP|nr:hypothetical protein BafPKo_AA0023 [Borreliella afzelii PKo]